MGHQGPRPEKNRQGHGRRGASCPDHPEPTRRAGGARAGMRVPITRKELDLFVQELSKHGVASWACRAIGRSRAGLEAIRGRDAEFARRWEEALEQADARIEVEAIRRSVDGVERVRVSGGDVVYDPRTGEPLIEREYSDLLLLNILRARNTRYAHQQRITVDHQNRGEAASIGFDDLQYLSGEERHQLLQLLARIEDRRNGRPEEGGELTEVQDAVFAELPAPDDHDGDSDDIGALSPAEAAELAAINGGVV